MAKRFRRRRRPAVVAALSALAWAGNAKAFCREVTISPPAGFDPAALGCFAGPNAQPALYWKNRCVGFSVQSSASLQVSLQDATNVATQAFAAWSGATCAGAGTPSISAVALSPADCNTVPSQGHNNVIIFRDNAWPYSDSTNAIGYTTLTVDLQTGEILGADIEINSANFRIVANGNPPAGAYDLASILTHEAGHFLGLAHSADATAVMYAYYKAGSSVLTADDIAGICSIYAPDGARVTKAGAVAPSACDPQPRNGFLVTCGSFDSGLAAGNSGTQAQPNDGGEPGATNLCPTTALNCSVGGRRAGRSGFRSFFAGGLALWLFATRRRTSRSRR